MSGSRGASMFVAGTNVLWTTSSDSPSSTPLSFTDPTISQLHPHIAKASKSSSHIFTHRAVQVRVLEMDSFPRCRHVNSTADLDAFLDDVYERPTVALALDSFMVHLDLPYPIDALRSALSAVLHVSDIVLFLPCDDTPDDILDGLDFTQLQLFKTNLPHRYLLPFLSQRTTITALCLGTCGRAEQQDCPLRGHSFKHVSTLECPTTCLAAVAHKRLLRLTVEEPSPSFSTPAALRSMRSPLFHLSALTLEFFPDDCDILETITRVAPRVEKLQLIEKPRTYPRRSQSRRAWNDHASWARSLFKLDCLEQLALRTSAAFARPASTASAEKQVLMKWVSRTTRSRHFGKSVHHHPTLSFIRVWYHSRDPGHGVITGWSKSTGSWENIIRTIGPPAHTYF